MDEDTRSRVGSENNTSYLFIPFRYNDPDDIKGLYDVLENSDEWKQVDEKIQYMLKYVADKLEGRRSGNRQCVHFELTDRGMAVNKISVPEDLYVSDRHIFEGQETEFRFRIQSVQLYCFNTSVCILAFRLCFEKNDPLWISAAQYYLKKVSREKIRHVGVETEKSETTFLELAKKIMGRLRFQEELSFFFYANENTERANLLTYLEVEDKEDYRYELFYLRRCYGDGYLYYEDEEADKREIYHATADIVWGFSPEAAVCLACPDKGRENFIRQRFYKNFNAQYLFMYILLLHQKYVLYMFLTMIDADMHNNLEILEDYRRRLYEFETDFVFSCVTEVPQYQNLYDRMSEAFSLKRMYEDVREPLTSLAEVRRSEMEKKQSQRDKKVNRALLLLSVLSFFSALIDGFDFVGSFGGMFLDKSMIVSIQIILVAVVFAVMIYIFIVLFRNKEE